MAGPTRVQSDFQDGTTSTDTLALAFPANVTAGHGYLALCGVESTTIALSAGFPQDSQGNTLIAITGSPFKNTTSTLEIFAYWVPSIGSTGANTVTFKFTTNPVGSELYILEINPNVGTLTLDSGMVTSSPGTGTISIGPETTNFPNELAIAYAYVSGAITGAGSGWTIDPESPTPDGNALEYQAVAARGTSVTGTFAGAAPGNSIGVMFSFYTPSGVLPTDAVFFGMT